MVDKNLNTWYNTTMSVVPFFMKDILVFNSEKQIEQITTN